MPEVTSAVPSYFSSCASIFLQLDLKRIPKHIAIIMDGNGRWAKSKGWMRVRGHEAATASVRESVRACGELGVSVLSLFAFSTENWSRPKEEVEFLFKLFQKTLESELEELKANNVRLRLCGDAGPLPEWLKATIRRCEEALAANTGLILNLAVNYGGKQDILNAVNQAVKGGAKKITEEIIAEHLLTDGLPDVDLMVRTSGELRISNFFLWQAAYAELYFPKILWPDFRREHLLEAVLEYQSRDRRFGNVK